VIDMNDNELKAVEKLLRLAKLAIIALLVIGGFMNQTAIMGLI
jgi:hypothetical protein